MALSVSRTGMLRCTIWRRRRWWLAAFPLKCVMKTCLPLSPENSSRFLFVFNKLSLNCPTLFIDALLVTFFLCYCSLFPSFFVFSFFLFLSLVFSFFTGYRKRSSACCCCCNEETFVSLVHSPAHIPLRRIIAVRGVCLVCTRVLLCMYVPYHSCVLVYS